MAAPLGVWPRLSDDAALLRGVLDAALLLNNDPRALAAALAVALGVRRMVSEPSPRQIHADVFMSELADAIRGAESWTARACRWLLDPDRDPERDHDISRSLDVVAGLVGEGDDALARRTLVAQAARFNPPQAVAQPSHPFAPAAIPMVFYRVLSAPNFLLGIEAVVLDGGDAATMGGMAGALLGARFGLQAIPQEWREGLVARHWLEPRAEIFITGRSRKTAAADDWLLSERQWTLDEEAARQALIAAMDEKNDRKGRREKARPKPGKKQEIRPAFSAAPGQDLPFAPPPNIWLRGGSANGPAGASGSFAASSGAPPAGGAVDPNAKPAKRSPKKKIIAWKEERRRHRNRRDGGEGE